MWPTINLQISSLLHHFHMPKSVVILQSSYIPWKGYFDLIHDADVFVFYDDVQFTKNDWRNRNRINTSQGLTWLTVPVGSKLSRRVCDVNIPQNKWQRKHFSTLKMTFAKAPFFEEYFHLIEDLYINNLWTSLSAMNQYAIQQIASILKINTQFIDSRQLKAAGNRNERLINIIHELEADTYISGPSAKSYLQESMFSAEGIEIVWKNYNGYPMYNQRFSTFEHSVSVLDLIFNLGPNAIDYIWGWRHQ